MHEVLVNRLGGLSLPRKSVVRLTDRPDMTVDVYRGRKTTVPQSIVIVNLSLVKMTLTLQMVGGQIVDVFIDGGKSCNDLSEAIFQK